MDVSWWHAFVNKNNYASPYDVAINKSQSEAGLNVVILDNDNNNSSNIKETRETIESGSDKGCITTMCKPFNTYLFELRERTICYQTKGHRYHYDCIYIGDVKSKANSSYEIKEIIIPIEKTNDKDKITEIIKLSIMNRETVNPFNIDYIVEILYPTLQEYKKQKLRLDESK